MPSPCPCLQAGAGTPDIVAVFFLVSFSSWRADDHLLNRTPVGDRMEALLRLSDHAGGELSVYSHSPTRLSAFWALVVSDLHTRQLT